MADVYGVITKTKEEVVMNPEQAFWALFYAAAHLNQSNDTNEVIIPVCGSQAGNHLFIGVNGIPFGYKEFIDKFLLNKKGTIVTFTEKATIVRLNRSSNNYFAIRRESNTLLRPDGTPVYRHEGD